MIAIKFVGSKSRIAKHIVPIIQSYIDKSKSNVYVEPFCLEENTNVYTKDGIKQIKDIVVGDYIYDDSGNLQKVISKVRSPETTGYKMDISGGIEIVATKDHIFYDESGHIVYPGESMNTNLLYGCSNPVLQNPSLDLAQFITTSSKKYGRSGSVVGDNKVKLYHNAPITNRIIPITKELMWCYGLVVAEGDPHNITLNINERNLAEQFIYYYKTIIAINFDDNIIYHPHKEKNSLRVAIPYPTIYKKIFFDAMGIGIHAQNKNLSFLFSVSPDMVKIALQAYMTGDGCIQKSGNGRLVKFKTTSKTLAKQLQTLLSIKFGIKSHFYYGINKARMIERRPIQETTYYTVTISQQEYVDFFLDDVPIDLHRNSRLFKVKGVQKRNGVFYDIRLEEGSSHRFILDGGIVTHNCGGGKRN